MNASLSLQMPGQWAQTGWSRFKGRLRSLRQPIRLYVHSPADTQDDWDGLAQAFEQWCAAHEGQSCELALSERFLLSCLTEAGLTREQMRQKALDQWAHYLDLEETALQDDWVWRHAALPGAEWLCAAPLGLIDALRDVAGEHGVRLLWVGPWWAHALQDWLAGLQAEGIDETVAEPELSLIEGGLCIRAQARLSAEGVPQLVRLWSEWHPGAMPSSGPAHQILSLSSPQQRGLAAQLYHAHLWALSPDARPLMRQGRLSWRAPRWAQALDFVGPRVHTALWSWFLLACGLLAAGMLAPRIDQIEQDRRDAQISLQRLNRAAHQQALAAKAPVLPDGKGVQAPPLTPDTAARAAQLAQWLGYPWMAVMRQIETTAQAEQAVMLSFSLDLATLGSKAGRLPDIRVSAAVQDDTSALRWAQAQGPSAQLLSRERLSTPFAAAAGQYDWRVEATWSGEEP